MGASLCPEKKVLQSNEETEEPDSPECASSQMVHIHQNTDKRDPHIKVTNKLMIRSVELRIVTDKGIGIRPLTVAHGKSIFICDVIPSDDGKMFDLDGNTASSFRVTVSQVGTNKEPEEWEVTNAENPRMQKF